LVRKLEGLYLGIVIMCCIVAIFFTVILEYLGIFWRTRQRCLHSRFCQI